MVSKREKRWQITSQRQLRTTIVDRFNRDDLGVLCSDIEHDLRRHGIENIQVNLDDLEEGDKTTQVQSLIETLYKQDCLSFLVDAVLLARPGIPLESLGVKSAVKFDAPVVPTEESTGSADLNQMTGGELPTQETPHTEKAKEISESITIVERGQAPEKKEDIEQPSSASIHQAELSETPITSANVSQIKCLHVLEKHADKVQHIAFSPDGQILASASFDKTVRLWQVFGGDQLHVLRGHKEAVQRVVFSPDGQILASASKDDTVRLWQASNGMLLHSLKGHLGNVRNLAFAPDGKTLASISADTTVRLWRVADGKLLRTLRGSNEWIFNKQLDLGLLLPNARLAIALAEISDSYNVIFTPDGATLASSGLKFSGGIHLWRVSDGELLYALQDTAGYVALSPDGTLLASHVGLTGKNVQLCRVSDGELLHMLVGHDGMVGRLAFSPDGTLLASGSSDKTARLWRVSDGKLLHTLKGQTAPVADVTFSPNGEILASASDNIKICLWRVTDGRLMRRLVGHTVAITSIAFSPNGTLLASGALDHTVRIWGIAV